MDTQSSHLSPAKQALLKKWKGKQSTAQTITKRPDAAPAPLSFSQQRLWFIDQYYRGSSFYNISGALHLQGTLNVSALQHSLNEILRRHEAWRTTFPSVAGQPVQAIAAPTPWSFPILDLEPTADWKSQVHQRAVADAQKPFDLATELPIRAILLRLNQQEHIFLLTMHHIVSDGWSIGVFMREVTTLYAAFSTGIPSPLPDLPIQYPDFTLWQRDRLQGDLLNTQLRYWTQQLSGELPILQLPARSRPAAATFRGSRQYFTLPKTLTTALHQLGQREEVTLFMLLLAAFNVLLYRYSEQDDILIGTSIANRSRPELEGMLGCFVNTLVMRTDLSGNPGFCQLLHRVRDVTLDAYTHPDLPFEKLVEELQPDRDLSRNPLFQVMFVLQNAPMPMQTIAGLIVEALEIDHATAMFDLFLSLSESEQGLTGIVEYNTDLFDAATITRLIQHFQVLLEGIVANPNQPIAALPLLSEQERSQLLVEWNHTHATYPSTTLHHLFEQQVERSPDDIAVIHDADQINYQELNRRANQLAHDLQQQGITSNTRVAICLERSIDLVISILAVLKAGGAYLPLDPGYPSDRLTFMLADAQATVLITQQAIGEKLSPASKIIYLDSDDHYLDQFPDTNLNHLCSDDIAYMIYTSGSTGTPKGVLGTHKGTVNGLHWLWRTYPFMPGEICCQKTAISFVDSIWEIFAPLLRGIPLVIIPDAVVKDPPQFLKSLADNRVSRLILVPSLLRLLLGTYGKLTQQLSMLTHWMTSGEALSLDVVQTFRQILPAARLINLYGSSEVSANVTCFDLHDLPKSATQIPIGRPIANTQIYLLDRQLQPLPVGICGDLYVGGDGLARGYWNRPDLTQARFIDHPLIPGATLFKIGDRAHYLPDGTLEYLGRQDDQIKIRGMRVELGEIQTAIAAHPDIDNAVVIPREDAQGDLRLIAYIITETDNAIPQLHQFLKERLPDYMLPNAYVVLAAFPLTPSGKIDRRSLSTTPIIQTEPQDSYVAPRTTTEMTLVNIWQDLLSVSPIGIRDSFFNVGGHSFLTVRLMAQIGDRFGQELPLSTLFQHPTIEQLAQILQQKTRPDSPLVAIRATGSKPPFFCIHPAGGNIITYPNLANQLDADQPFYAIEQNPTASDPPVISVQETASRYIEQIQQIQPQGPYQLGGWCYGGIIAFEMAQQLQKQGQSISLLVVFDAILPDSNTPPIEDNAQFLIRIAESAKHLFGIDFLVSYDELRSLSPDEQFSWMMHKGNITNAVEIQQHLRSYKLFKSHVQALREYIPTIYPGIITLFRAREKIMHEFHNPEFISDDPELGWGKCSNHFIQTIEVSGNHFSMFTEPHVSELAKQLQYCLDRNLHSVNRKNETP